MTDRATLTTQLKWLNAANFVYGGIGLFLIADFGAPGSWKSFVAGWAFAVLNYELLKRIGFAALSAYDSDGAKLDPKFYVFLVGKFVFWGSAIAIFMTTGWLQAAPLLFGITTILVTGLGFGMKELINGK